MFSKRAIGHKRINYTVTKIVEKANSEAGYDTFDGISLNKYVTTLSLITLGL